MSWFGNIRKGFRDEIFDKQLEEYYTAIRISKYKALDIAPDYDESMSHDSDFVSLGLLPVVEGDFNEETRGYHNFTNKRGKIKSKKIRVPITKKLREFVYQRAEYRCEHCQNDIIQQIHHIDNNPSNNDISNLQGVCYECHKVLTAYIRVEESKQNE